MKKLYLLLTVIALLFVFGGCKNDRGSQAQSGTDSSASVSNSESNSDVDVTGKGFRFIYKEKEVFCDQNAEDALSVLGEYENKFESPSCAFDGVEVTYYYSAIQLTTYTDGEVPEKVLSIYLQDDSVATAEGITIGDSVDKVKAAYGEPAENGENSMVFLKDSTRLTFIFNEDGVSSVMYSLVAG